MSTLGERTVLAIDPGTSKCGVACVNRNGDGEFKILWKGIVPPAEIGTIAIKQRELNKYSLVAVGGGTASRPIVETLREHIPSIGILIVDEKDTTMDARARYWEHNPRRGWRRLLPATMQLPPQPVDDFVAVILAERVLST
jgi:RNase H-fold protein (predicted Holliday junction resolvase)